ncbi:MULTISPECIES: hypothetical protein [unclassified Leifsonia]|uniref:hypothetical protein n=1 Tax=unclassified Leifsonia TaxID=2663824 RepID=UPI0006F29E07|nr:MULTISPECIES: hypothetical protein [unclassified Leifsonia]KQX07468.1 hypothetical protein ASC59_06835 [Leifsonia sp. Root1293]KRA11750.1 hypothetical protein ASD61_06835 [Leifsonia sp. Root60]
MFPNRSDDSTTERTRSPWFTVVAILIATAVLTTGTTAAAAAQAAERTERVAEARTAAIGEVSHRVGVGAGSVDLSASRLSSALDLATYELSLAGTALSQSAGKATEATRTALQSSTAAAGELAATSTDVDAVLAAVYGLRELEKKTTGEVAVWQKAEDARIAAAAAAAAAEAAAQAAAEASAAVSWSDESSSDSWAESDAAAESPAAEPAASAPAPAADAPVNDDCGPCPGATLVPIVSDGITYWGCP